MQYFAGTPHVLPPALLADMGRYRYRVFVGKLGWPLQCDGDLEYDEFDREDTVYVVAQDPEGVVTGTARLLPTTRPYLLQKAFRNLWGGNELPDCHTVWELSRFAAVDFRSSASSEVQASAGHARDLFRKAVSLARRQGAKTLITVSPIGMERLLRASGFSSMRAGAPTMCCGVPIVALKIDCEDIEE
ncbi:acyl-homoserine-lactone synthase [Ideonella sp. DXS29W]|uniref:Acyl-homoserine-lactone synthase n=1 Tax=Ideonella lacteola TaxID=2984193 RepID=A0ABU9BZ74_9BURK